MSRSSQPFTQPDLAFAFSSTFFGRRAAPPGPWECGDTSAEQPTASHGTVQFGPKYTCRFRQAGSELEYAHARQTRAESRILSNGPEPRHWPTGCPQPHRLLMHAVNLPADSSVMIPPEGSLRFHQENDRQTEPYLDRRCMFARYAPDPDANECTHEPSQSERAGRCGTQQLRLRLRDLCHLACLLCPSCR